MRCGGTGILRVSDLRVVLSAPAGSGANAGAADGAASSGSTSIINSSSSAPASALPASPSCMSSSWSAVVPLGFGTPFLRETLLRFFLFVALAPVLVDGEGWTVTMVEEKN